MKVSRITPSAASRTSSETVASKTFAVPRSRIGLDPCRRGAATRPGPGASRPRCHGVRAADRRQHPRRRSSRRVAIEPEGDTVDRREPGERGDHLCDAAEHRRAPAAVVERPGRSNGRHRVGERDVEECRAGRDRAREPARALVRGRAVEECFERRPWDSGIVVESVPCVEPGRVALAEEVDGDRHRVRRRCLRRRVGGRARRRRLAALHRRTRSTRGDRSRSIAAMQDTSHGRDPAWQLFGNQSAASRASAASVRPTTGANLKPWPEQAEPTTMRPCRSRTKPSSAVFV